MKYSNDLGLSEIFASKLIDLYFTLGWNVDLVIPVPLGRLRQRGRGYNQSDLVGRNFSRRTKIKYDASALARIRETKSQVKLEMSEREKNVFGAFAVSKAGMINQRILVIDDIATTGATLSACADALLSAGAAEVLAITVARAL